MDIQQLIGAIALGARAIEKHFTDKNSRLGPDKDTCSWILILGVIWCRPLGS